MKIQIKQFALLIVLIFVLGITTIFPTSVLAYSIGAYHWDSTGTTYNMSSLPAAWQTQVSNAAGSWNGAGASFTFTSSSSSVSDLIQVNMPDEYSIALSGGMY
jgi:hypothetical protein